MKRERMMKGNRALAAWLAFVIAFTTLAPVGSHTAQAEGTTAARSSAPQGFCIDGVGGSANPAKAKSDQYAPASLAMTLPGEESAIVFWAALSMLASRNASKEISKAIENIKNQAPAEFNILYKPVTEADLKLILHVPSVRARYGWLNTVLANQEQYLQMAGLIGASGGASVGGGVIPAVLQDHTETATALEVDRSSFTISFDPGGADADFIAKVPLKFSSTGDPGSFVPEPMGGWTYQKTDTSIVFTNVNPEPSKLIVKFDPAGTTYESAGAYSSPEQVYEDCLKDLQRVAL